MTINPDAPGLALLASGGTFITIELLPKSAPQTVNSFVFLARTDGSTTTTFHRVLPGFINANGDPAVQAAAGHWHYDEDRYRFRTTRAW